MKMIDALFPNAIPAGINCDIIAAYIDHTANPHSYAQAVARFPQAIHLKISVRGTVGADILDVENGTIMNTPGEAVDWLRRSLGAGYTGRTVYCNQNNSYNGWDPLRRAVAAARLPQPYWWVANYDGNAVVPDGAAAKQYTDRDANGRNTYDTSVTTPEWPARIGASGMSTVMEQQVAWLFDQHRRAVAPGQKDWAGTVKATLAATQHDSNIDAATVTELNKIAVALGVK